MKKYGLYFMKHINKPCHRARLDAVAILGESHR